MQKVLLVQLAQAEGRAAAERDALEAQHAERLRELQAQWDEEVRVADARAAAAERSALTRASFSLWIRSADSV